MNSNKFSLSLACLLCLCLVTLFVSTTVAVPAQSERQGRWIWDWLGFGELFGTCSGQYKICGPPPDGPGRDCCNDWVCRLSQVDLTRYCMENLNIPYEYMG